MKRLLNIWGWAGLAICTMVSAAEAQTPWQVEQLATFLEARSIARNSVTNLHAEGDTLWIGPEVQLTLDGGQTWLNADVAEHVQDETRMFSIDAEGALIWVGLGRTIEEADGSTEVAAAGFIFSTDGGQTWNYRLPQLDSPEDDTEVYGISVLPALPVIVPQQSPPFDIDYDPIRDVVWVAGWASGIRRSEDRGATWRRTVLPPDTLDEIRPDLPYNFPVAPERQASDEANNYLGFSVLVDEEGLIWAGTAAGLNRSLDGGISWRRFHYEGTAGSLLGDWVTSVEEQPLVGRNAVWASNWRAELPEENFGVVVTHDGGDTFQQTLIGEKIYDFAFNGATVYAAGDNGLFISDNNGASWQTVRSFRDANQPDRFINPEVSVFAVAVVNQTLWVGTGDGLLKSENGGATWTVIRTEVPVNPANPTADIPDVTTYAYPNPFSPSGNRFVRIRYEVETATSVQIRIFDFGMHLVRNLIQADRSVGQREDLWDGTDNHGARVPNGTYFYQVKTGAGTFWGKILLVE